MTLSKRKRLRILDCEPHNISEVAWWYEEKEGICFVHEVRDEFVHLRTDTILIPFPEIADYVRSRRLQYRRKRAKSPKSP